MKNGDPKISLCKGTGVENAPADGGVSAMTSRPSVTFDVAAYEDYLAGADLSDAEKEELLRALWNIIVEFVSFGFGVHPLQQAHNDDESAQPASKNFTLSISDMVGSKQPNIEHKKLNRPAGAAHPGTNADSGHDAVAEVRGK